MKVGVITKVKGLKLSPLLRYQLYVSFGLLFVSGCAWLWLHYYGGQENEFGRSASPLEPVMLVLHGCLVPWFLLVFGSLFPTHIVRAWKCGLNRATGIGILSICFALIVTGLLLYYSGSESGRRIASSAHAIIGVGSVVILLGHIAQGRKVMAPQQSGQQGGTSCVEE